MRNFSEQDKIGIILLLAALLLVAGYFFHVSKTYSKNTQQAAVTDPWKERLTPKQYSILREAGTEAPYTSDLLNEKRAGTYYAADTQKPVFRSEDKYESGTGWPSFTKPINSEAVEEARDITYGMARTEILSTAGGHLGHVFQDGPTDRGGLRYCINGGALYFVPDADTEKEPQ